MDADPLAAGRRIRADVHGDIEDVAAHDPHQLALRLRRPLKVKPPQDPAFGARMILLHEGLVDSRRCELGSLVDLHEEAPLVAEHAWLNQDDVGDRKPLEAKWHRARESPGDRRRSCRTSSVQGGAGRRPRYTPCDTRFLPGTPS